MFEPNNCEVRENYSKDPLNFSPLKCTYLGKNQFQYHLRLVRKVATENFGSVYKEKNTLNLNQHIRIWLSSHCRATGRLGDPPRMFRLTRAFLLACITNSDI